MPHLLGERVLLREYRAEDLPAILSWVNDEQSVRYLSTRYWSPQSVANTSEFLDHVTHAMGNSAYFVIANIEDESYLGQIDLYTIDWKLRCGTLGMVVGAAGQRGHGYGTEALELLLRYAFQTLGLERVELEVQADNAAARRCYDKAGFTLEGIKRHAFFLDGAYCDVAVMSVLSGEWRAARFSHGGEHPGIG